MKTRLKVFVAMILMAVLVLPYTYVNAGSVMSGDAKLYTMYKILTEESEFTVPQSVTFSDGRVVPLATYKSAVLTAYASNYLYFDSQTSLLKLQGVVLPRISGSFRALMDDYGHYTEENLPSLYHNFMLTTVLNRKKSKLAEYQQVYNREMAKEEPDETNVEIALGFINSYTDDIEALSGGQLIDLPTEERNVFNCLPFLYSVNNTTPTAINSNGQVVESNNINYYIYAIVFRDLRLNSLSYTINGMEIPITDFDKDKKEYTVTLSPYTLEGTTIQLNSEGFTEKILKDNKETYETNLTIENGKTMIHNKKAGAKVIVTFDCRNYPNEDGIGIIRRAYSVNFVVRDFAKGDMNLDDKVNSTDAAIVLEKYSNQQVTQTDLERGDMNGDGKLNSTDAAMILEVFANGK